MNNDEKIVPSMEMEGETGLSEITPDLNESSSSFINALMRKKDEIEQHINRLTESQKEQKALIYDQYSVEELDQAEREISLHKSYSLLERKIEELTRLEKLIKKVEKDEDFGICDECGERISPERLTVMPEASTCIDCQRELEKMKKSMNFKAGYFRSSQEDVGWDDDEDDEQEYKRFTSKLDDKSLALEDLDEVDIEDAPLDDDDNPGHLNIGAQKEILEDGQDFFESDQDDFR